MGIKKPPHIYGQNQKSVQHEILQTKISAPIRTLFVLYIRMMFYIRSIRITFFQSIGMRAYYYYCRPRKTKDVSVAQDCRRTTGRCRRAPLIVRAATDRPGRKLQLQPINAFIVICNCNTTRGLRAAAAHGQLGRFVAQQCSHLNVVTVSRQPRDASSWWPRGNSFLQTFGNPSLHSNNY